MFMTTRIYRILMMSLGVVAGVFVYLMTSNLNTSILNAAIVSLLGLLISYLRVRGTAGRFIHAPIESYFYSSLELIDQPLLVIDRNGKISFLNSAFEEFIGIPQNRLLMKDVRELSWKWQDQDSCAPVPWTGPIREAKDRNGVFVLEDDRRSLAVKMRPRAITNPVGLVKGAICILTLLDAPQATVSKGNEPLLEAIRKSASHIRQQNSEIETLSILDPITGIYNRHTGLELLDRLWISASDNREGLACAMIDIDHFRKVNSEVGRTRADKLLFEIAEILQSMSQPDGIVCRYGGEEFLAIFPRTSLIDAACIAERIRLHVSRSKKSDVNLTVSVGVAGWQPHHSGSEELIDDAERHLRHAKERGRNQVVKDLTDLPETKSRAGARDLSVSEPQTRFRASVPFPAVMALFSALAYRDHATAAHSHRVAELCFSVAQSIMSMRNCYLLETAALLHDIGKIGVSDELLLKPEQLTEAELETVKHKGIVGVEIIRAAIGSAEITNIIELAKVPFNQLPESSSGFTLASRILAVTDAYDSLMSNQLYLGAMSHDESIEELKRCSGTQFDPEIVNQFIQSLTLKPKDVLETELVDKDVALALCARIEPLSDAMDRQDLNQLQALAKDLSNSIIDQATLNIRLRASELDRAISEGEDQLGTLQIANDLLEACRAVQTTYLTHYMHSLGIVNQHH